MGSCLLVPTKVRSNPGGAEHRRVFFYVWCNLKLPDGQTRAHSSAHCDSSSTITDTHKRTGRHETDTRMSHQLLAY